MEELGYRGIGQFPLKADRELLYTDAVPAEAKTQMTNGLARHVRFSSVLEPRGGTEPWDIPVAASCDYVVTPTLGSIIPNWLLLIPRRDSLNFLEVASGTHGRPHQFLLDAVSQLGCAGEEWIWFEHGPSARNTPVGCGVDYAHLHLLIGPPFALDEMAASVAAVGSWEKTTALAAYEGLSADVPYYLCGDSTRALRLTGRDLRSQFFRRTVASLVGRQDEWDYNTHAFEENVLATLDRFRELSAAAE